MFGEDARQTEEVDVGLGAAGSPVLVGRRPPRGRSGTMFTRLLWIGQVWETCQFFVSCTKSVVSEVRSHRPAGVLLVRRLREAREHRPNRPRSWSRRTVNWFWVWGSVRITGSCLGARCVFGAGYQLFRTPAARGARSATAGIVLFGKGWPVTGSMIVVVNRPASWSGVGTM